MQVLQSYRELGYLLCTCVFLCCRVVGSREISLRPFPRMYENMQRIVLKCLFKLILAKFTHRQVTLRRYGVFLAAGKIQCRIKYCVGAHNKLNPVCTSGNWFNQGGENVQPLYLYLRMYEFVFTFQCVFVCAEYLRRCCDMTFKECDAHVYAEHRM